MSILLWWMKFIASLPNKLQTTRANNSKCGYFEVVEVWSLELYYDKCLTDVDLIHSDRTVNRINTDINTTWISSLMYGHPTIDMDILPYI